MSILQRNTFFDQVAQRSGLVDFWRWWRSELRASFLPLAPLAARWLSAQGEITAIELGVDGLNVQGSGAIADTAKVECIALKDADPADTRNRIDAALGNRPRDVQIFLAREIFLVKRVIYPQATEPHLREVLGLDMDRQTPFTAAQVFFDARVVKRIGSGNNNGNEENASIEVELVVVPRYVLDPVLALLQSAGATVRSVTIADDATTPRFELLHGTERPRQRHTRAQIVNRAIACIIALLAVAALVLPIWQNRELARELQPLVEDARAKAGAARQIESDFTQRAQEYNFAVGKKHAAYPAIELLDELSRLSPDTTWLQSLELKSIAGKAGVIVREVQVTGEAASGSKMIELFERSTLLQNTSQRAQTTRGSQPGTERFQIASEVKSRALPAVTELALDPSGGPATLTPTTPLPATKTMPASASSPTPPAMAPVPSPPLPPATGTRGGQP